MIKITIPANQRPNEGEYMTIIINDRVSVHLKAKEDTSSASYDESFYTHEFDRIIHGFRGINDDLLILCYELSK